MGKEDVATGAEELSAEEASDWSNIWSRNNASAEASSETAEDGAEGADDAEEATEDDSADASEDEADEADEATESEESSEEETEDGAELTEEQKLEAFKKQAEKLGYSVDGGRVALEERKAFREAKRRNQEWVEAEKKKIETERESVKSEAEKLLADAKDRLSNLDEFEKAVKTRDYEDIAKALGFEDWNALQEDVYARNSDPGYQRMKELERREKERSEQEKKAKEEAEATKKRMQKELEDKARSEQEAKNLAEYRTKLSEHMKASDHKILRAFHDDAPVLNTIMAIQRENYDPDTRTTVSVQDAIKMNIPGTNTPMIKIMTANYERYRAAFGEPKESGEESESSEETPAASAPAAKKPAKKAPKSTAVRGKGTRPAPPEKKELRRWLSDGARQLQQAMMDDDSEDRGRRTG